ncbi:cytochrome P450 CYP736A12-like [Neltuma alba]|uniref:cytochrome P450 CYP736A12-like n=1 Tax=Neltuma alba TaxID=207710 RepID=UPI0010A46C34|nr:cytochrome P450 CYP736A12-like [Prosopis alba]
MSLRLGQVPAVVVSSPEAAELLLKTHDVVFASRPRTQASEFLSYGSKGIAFAEYGPYWCDMRKLRTLQLFSVSRVEMFRPMRREELREAVKSIKESAAARDVVDDSHDDEQNPVKDQTNIKAILLDLLSGAIDTSVTVSLWVFSELLKNPRVMKKLQHELENLVGKSNLVAEVDLLGHGGQRDFETTSCCAIAAPSSQHRGYNYQWILYKEQVTSDCECVGNRTGS